MTIHFICIGNAFRSLIAETYLTSLKLNGVEAMSSGVLAYKYRANNEKKQTYQKTLALLKRHGIDSYAKGRHGDQTEQGRQVQGDIVICMNQIVYDSLRATTEPPRHVIIWNIMDQGEIEQVPKTDKEVGDFFEKTFQDIKTNIDSLVDELSLE